MFYKRISELEMRKGAEVQFVGVYVLKWGELKQPTDGFVEATEEEIRKYLEQGDERVKSANQSWIDKPPYRQHGQVCHEEYISLNFRTNHIYFSVNARRSYIDPNRYIRIRYRPGSEILSFQAGEDKKECYTLNNKGSLVASALFSDLRKIGDPDAIGLGSVRYPIFYNKEAKWLEIKLKKPMQKINKKVESGENEDDKEDKK